MDAHPSKNPRKARGRSRDSQEITAPMGHIFIAETLVSKKTGGKKVRAHLRILPFLLTQIRFPGTFVVS